MEVEALAALTVPPKSLQELAMEGQQVLEATIEAAYETLMSMNEVLCNPALWSTSSSSATVTSAASVIGTGSTVIETSESGAPRVDGNKIEGMSTQEAGWAALDEARLHLRSSTASLRAVITAVFNSMQMAEQENLSSHSLDNSDLAEVEKLEQRVSMLREEVKNKNRSVKLLIDQLRELVDNISMWQAPGL